MQSFHHVLKNDSTSLHSNERLPHFPDQRCKRLTNSNSKQKQEEEQQKYSSTKG